MTNRPGPPPRNSVPYLFVSSESIRQTLDLSPKTPPSLIAASAPGKRTYPIFVSARPRPSETSRGLTVRNTPESTMSVSLHIACNTKTTHLVSRIVSLVPRLRYHDLEIPHRHSAKRQPSPTSRSRFQSCLPLENRHRVQRHGGEHAPHLVPVLEAYLSLSGVCPSWSVWISEHLTTGYDTYHLTNHTSAVVSVLAPRRRRTPPRASIAPSATALVGF